MEQRRELNTKVNTKVVKVFAKTLAVHPNAQRDIVPQRLNKLIETLDLDAIGVLHGVEYPINGSTKIWIIDGQHRLRALMEHDLGDREVEVKVHVDAIDDARAAELFILLNDRAKVSPYDNFRNEVRASQAAAVIINRIVLQRGLQVSRSRGDNKLACINVMKNLYAVDQGTSLQYTIEVVQSAWGSGMTAMESKIIEGVGSVVSRYRLAIDREALIKKLADYPGGAAGLLGDARGLAGMRKVPLVKCVAERVIETYNKQRRPGTTLSPLGSVVEA